MAVERRVSCEVVWKKKQSQKTVIVIIGNPAMRRRGGREENEEDEGGKTKIPKFLKQFLNKEEKNLNNH